MTKEQKIKFLRAYLKKLQIWYDESFKLVPGDLPPEPDKPPTTNLEEEQVARIADDYGFNGSLYRREIRDPYPLSKKSINRLKEKIETIPKIIAEIEKPVNKSVIPLNAKLINISQLAGLLQIGESVVREKNNKGLIPKPVPFSGNLMWVKKEIDKWLSVGCPARAQWEQSQSRGA